ncbi:MULTISPECIES: transaldolase [unclassified Campylobacter]|uniref:transaldolase n=1 Tax=unclassified Campylobacter TaxID=2593542 RepID=UPI003D3430CE
MYNNEAKFSLWCDFIERDFIDGELLNLLNHGVINGATSNPAIFKIAFSSGKSYANSVQSATRRHPKEIYELLATQDIKMAASKMLKNFASDDDGFVSIEVDPHLANDAMHTIQEGVRLYNLIKMPNVMIKIPATKAGFEAMKELMAQGISVNATLIFSPDQAQGCLDAFKTASEIYTKRFPNTPLPKGVISVFVSRFDRLLNEGLAMAGLPKNQVGIMNATKIYHIINDTGLPNVRTLFASTGVKGDDIAADYYVRELMFANSINTAPVETIEAFIKSPAQPKTPISKESIDVFFSALKSKNIDINLAYRKLLDDGLKAFVTAFDEIMASLQ